MHNYDTLCIHYSESICTNTVTQCHLPKDTLWLLWIFEARPRSPSHAGLHPQSYQHQSDFGLKREGRRSALQNCCRRAGTWEGPVSNKPHAASGREWHLAHTYPEEFTISNKVLFGLFSISSERHTVPLKSQSQRTSDSRRALRQRSHCVTCLKV